MHLCFLEHFPKASAVLCHFMLLPPPWIEVATLPYCPCITLQSFLESCQSGKPSTGSNRLIKFISKACSDIGGPGEEQSRSDYFSAGNTAFSYRLAAQHRNHNRLLTTQKQACKAVRHDDSRFIDKSVSSGGARLSPLRKLSGGGPAWAPTSAVETSNVLRLRILHLLVNKKISST